MENKDIVELVKEMAYNGKDYDTIMKFINDNELRSSNELIKLAKRKVDDYIIEYQIANEEKLKSFNQIIAGFVIFLSGILLIGYTYFRYSTISLWFYVPVLSGTWIIKEGYKVYRQPVEKFLQRKSKFKKNRGIFT